MLDNNWMDDVPTGSKFLSQKESSLSLIHDEENICFLKKFCYLLKHDQHIEEIGIFSKKFEMRLYEIDPNIRTKSWLNERLMPLGYEVIKIKKATRNNRATRIQFKILKDQ